MRIGTTSFIHPGSWVDNVRRLGADFEDIEILFFEAEGESAFPSAAECRALRDAKRAFGLTYSLHTPLEASLASADGSRRLAGVSSVLRALDVASTFDPENVVVHVYLGDGERDPNPPRDLDPWRDRARESLLRITSAVPPERLCVELLDYDYQFIEPVVRELGLSVAFDVGHLVRDGLDELGALARLLPLTRIVQWHGTDPNDRDHRSLEHYPRGRALALLAALRAADYRGVLTLEVFRAADLESSRRVLADLLRELDGGVPAAPGAAR
jgi:sugar phosphate isomerase/epimerase